MLFPALKRSSGLYYQLLKCSGQFYVSTYLGQEVSRLNTVSVCVREGVSEWDEPPDSQESRLSPPCETGPRPIPLGLSHRRRKEEFTPFASYLPAELALLLLVNWDLHHLLPWSSEWVLGTQTRITPLAFQFTDGTSWNVSMSIITTANSSQLTSSYVGIPLALRLWGTLTNSTSRERWRPPGLETGRGGLLWGTVLSWRQQDGMLYARARELLPLTSSLWQVPPTNSRAEGWCVAGGPAGKLCRRTCPLSGDKGLQMLPA